MIREIVKYGSKVLRRKANPVDEVAADTHALVQDLFDTLEEADGVGLAAPQIGVSRRVIVVDVSGQQEILPIALINPTILIGEGMAMAEEGCLSVPDLYGEVSRYTNVEIEALDRQGTPFKLKAEGFFSRVLQHEIDHLDGKLFIDYLTLLKRQLMLGSLRRIKKEGETWDKRHLTG